MFFSKRSMVGPSFTAITFKLLISTYISIFMKIKPTIDSDEASHFIQLL